MKKFALIVCWMLAATALNSCQTGYSKSSYINSLEKFVNKTEDNWRSYDDGDWNKADERMELFKEKYDKYIEKFSTEEKKKVSKLMIKYKFIRLKGGAKGLWEDLTGMYEEGKGMVEGVIDEMQDLTEYADTLNSIFHSFK